LRQLPEFPGRQSPIDIDTLDWAQTTTPLFTGKQLQLVFSDEFNTDGRTFHPGDDPHWEAVDLHCWATDNFERYDPNTITTQGRALRITLSETRPPHNLNYTGGIMTGWNQFCFMGGYLEAAVTLPGPAGVAGLWPAVLSVGSLGRAGYDATLDRMVRVPVAGGGILSIF
jgi:beta-glucanase (GH16 family)